MHEEEDEMIGLWKRSAAAAVVFGVVLLVASLSLAGSVSAHKHSVTTGNDEEVVIANGQNHPGFVAQSDGTIMACEGVNLPVDGSSAGPAGYGLETAHHGPDLDPGNGDGCYRTDGPAPPADTNPAID
jgi:hypothetical protein